MGNPGTPKGGINRRKQVRVEADLTVRFSDAQGGFVEECIGNVSKGGIFIETLKPRALKEVLELFLMLPDTHQEIAVQAEVVHVCGKDEKKDGEFRGRMGMGMRFLLIEPKQKAELKSYIEGMLESRGSGSREHSRFYDYKPIRMKMKSVSEFRSLFMPNLSRGGLYFETKEELTLFDVLDVILEPPGSGKEIHLACEVVHIRKSLDGDPDTFGIGVKFIHMNAERRAMIDLFIKNLLKQE